MSIQELLTISQTFTSEIIRAEKNEESSLPYIRHTLPDVPLVEDGEVFQVLVIGGTVFRSAICKKENGRISVISKTQSHPPQFKIKDDFLSFITGQVDKDIRVLALNFAYPLKPVFDANRLDGILLSGTKENEFTGLIGEKIGEEVAKAIKDVSGKTITVTIANDTICLLLSGLSQYKKEEIFGGIVGTGVNFAYFADTLEAVNLESANFNKFPLSAEATYIDSVSVHKGKALFEKEVSGAYLYKQYNLHHPDRLLSDTSALAALSKGVDEDARTAQKLLDRSASLVACQIAGILEFKKKNMVGVMEGSLFWKADNYKTLVETYLSLLSKYTVRFTKFDDDSIIGGAMLVG